MSDYISRQDVINLIQEDKIKLVEPYLSIYKSTGCIKEAETQAMTCNRHIEMIKNLPSADVVERKKGEWVPADNVGDCCYKCSICGYVYDAYSLRADNFCQSCGADMRGDKDA